MNMETLPEMSKTAEVAIEEKPAIPLAGVIYGDLIYWLTILATVVVICGSVLTFITTSNYIDPNYLLSAIWEGKSVEQIWTGAISAGQVPNGHWYLNHLTTGNGITTGGIALGVFSVLPGIVGAAYVLFKQGERLFGFLAVLSAIVTGVAVIY